MASQDLLELMRNAPEIDDADIYADPEMCGQMMDQLMQGPGNPTYTEIIPNLDLGRVEDTNGEDYSLAVCGTVADRLNKSFDRSTVRQLPVLPGKTDVTLESFTVDNSEVLKSVIQEMHSCLTDNKKVFVGCQQGKDRSVVIVVAYLKAVYGVSANEAYNFIKNRRLIVTANDVPDYNKFMERFNFRLDCI